MRRHKTATVFLFIILIITGFECVSFQSDRQTPRNIILFIGDGMGIAQVTAAKTVVGSLHMERCPVGGFHLTHSADEYVTDSGAGGTALATGRKTNNWIVSVSPDTIPLQSVLEVAEKHHKSTGLVCTSSITNATPAAFAAHNISRDNQFAIAEDLSRCGAEVLIGGGTHYFIPDTVPGGRRSDGINLLERFEGSHQICTTPESFDKIDPTQNVIALLAGDGLSQVQDRHISLVDMTQKALSILSQNEKGFFLMVEGSQIDWAAHDQDIKRIIDETIDFDQAVGIGLDFAQSHGNTLVVITADHETAGFTLVDGSLVDKTTRVELVTDWHTATMVPLFAYGPMSEDFGGIHDNTFIGKTLKELVRQY